MNVRGLLFLLSRLQLALGAALLFPAAVARASGSDDASVFFISAAVAGGIGLAGQQFFRQAADFRFGRREAFVLVTSAWFSASLVGALPYVLVHGPGFAVDGLFESVSGFTTTGASILTDVEAQPVGLLFWRAMTQWIGGMGIIVLGIAILPKLAVGGMDLLDAEAPGPVAEKLTPRIAQTAKALWGIYLLLTASEALVLMLLGIDPFEAVTHAMTTMSSGGFSTRAASIGAYGSSVQVVVTLFMVLAGINFGLHFRVLRGRIGPVARDSELRFYAALIGVSTVLLAADLLNAGLSNDLVEALRLGAFQAATIVSTTGFATDDFSAWPHFSRTLLFLLMFVGGCSGSTGGSVKVVRIVIVAKKMVTDVRRLIQPHAVLPVRVGSKAVPEEIVTSVTTFFILFLTVFVLGGAALALDGLDLESAFSASAACLGNIGPGLDAVGPTKTYAGLAVPSKLLLMGMMIVGRLELYTAVVGLYLMGRLLGRR